MKIDTLSVDFSDEQKRYLEGFTTGLQISRVGRGLGGSASKANTEATGPDAVHIKAQDKVIAAGKKLADQEKFKRDEHPFDAYPRLRSRRSTTRRRARRTISAGAITASSTSRRRRTPTCAGCASRTAS